MSESGLSIQPLDGKQSGTAFPNTVVMAGQFGLDPNGHLWIDTPDGPQPMPPIDSDHPLATQTGATALLWTLAVSEKHRALTPAQRRALDNPTRPRLRCLPALEAAGLITGTQRTELGELVWRVARKLSEHPDD